MIASVVIYPLGWESAKAQEICGPTASRYNLGQCDIKWAYILAIIGCLDVIVLAILAFILATRHIKLQPEPLYGKRHTVGVVSPFAHYTHTQTVRTCMAEKA
jgi:Lipoma HMGIC fusion partner-like protein.